MARFVVTRAPGPNWDPARPTREQDDWDGHAAFMDALAAERLVAFGGPAGRENKVVLVFDAADAATVQARLELDRWTSADLLRIVTIEPWTIWMGEDERVARTNPGELYLVGYRPGPDWDPDKPRREQAGWEEHAAFIDALSERGVVVLGGPLDERRALLVMQHQHGSTLQAQLAEDPWNDGVLTIEYVEPWRLWLRPSIQESSSAG